MDIGGIYKLNRISSFVIFVTEVADYSFYICI